MTACLRSTLTTSPSSPAWSPRWTTTVSPALTRTLRWSYSSRSSGDSGALTCSCRSWSDAFAAAFRCLCGCRVMLYDHRRRGCDAPEALGDFACDRALDVGPARFLVLVDENGGVV